MISISVDVAERKSGLKGSRTEKGKAMTELKPCPFCGAEVKLEKEWADALSVFYNFNCYNCGMFCFQNECVPKDIAIEAWNRRADND